MQNYGSVEKQDYQLLPDAGGNYTTLGPKTPGFQIAGVYIDNLTPVWWQIKQTGQWIPPYTMGWSRNFRPYLTNFTLIVGLVGSTLLVGSNIGTATLYGADLAHPEQDTVVDDGGIDSAVQAIQALTATLIITNADLTITNTKLDTLHTDLTTLNTTVGVTNTTLTATNIKLDTLHADLVTLNTTLGTTNTTLTSTNTKLDTLHTDLATLDTDLGTTNSKLTTVNTNLTTLNTTVGTTNTTLTSTNTKLDTLHADLVTLNTTVGTTNTTLTSTNTKLDTLNTSVNTVNTTLGTTNTKLTTLDTDLVTLTAALNALNGGWGSTTQVLSLYNGFVSTGLNQTVIAGTAGKKIIPVKIVVTYDASNGPPRGWLWGKFMFLTSAINVAPFIVSAESPMAIIPITPGLTQAANNEALSIVVNAQNDSITGSGVVMQIDYYLK